MSEWVNVKKQLPEKDNWKVYAVITRQDDLHKFKTAWFQFSDKTFRLEDKPNDPIKVTHWMNLPEKPND